MVLSLTAPAYSGERPLPAAGATAPAISGEPGKTAGIVDFGTWRAKAIVLDVVENSIPPAHTLRVIDEPASGPRAAFLQAASWCKDGVRTKLTEDETELGWAFYPAHRVQKCEAYPAN